MAVSIVFLLYFIVLIFARRADKRDLGKVCQKLSKNMHVYRERQVHIVVQRFDSSTITYCLSEVTLWGFLQRKIVVRVRDGKVSTCC